MRVAAASFVLGASLAACEDASGPGGDLSDNWRKWRALRPDQYEFQFRRICFCGGEATEPVRITVNGDQVTAVVREADGQPVPPQQAELFFRVTIDSIFGVVAAAIAQQASELRVTYHAVLGYPVATVVDYRLNVADDELMLSAQLLANAAR
jgi:hypothetical protein